MTADSQTLVLVGRITSVFGIKGWVNVYSYTDPQENILDFSEWLLVPAEGDGQTSRKTVPKITECTSVSLGDGQRSGKKIVAQIAGSDTRDKAGEYIRHDIFIKRANLPELEEDEFYWADLEGMQVSNLQEQVLGKVDRLIATGANDVMIVKDEGNEEHLIPYVEEHYVIEVDLEKRLIKVDWEID